MIEHTIEHYNVFLPTAREAKEMFINRDYQWLIKNQFEAIIEAIDKGNASCLLADSWGIGYYKPEQAKEKFRKYITKLGYRIVTDKDNREWLCWD